MGNFTKPIRSWAHLPAFRQLSSESKKPKPTASTYDCLEGYQIRRVKESSFCLMYKGAVMVRNATLSQCKSAMESHDAGLPVEILEPPDPYFITKEDYVFCLYKNENNKKVLIERHPRKSDLLKMVMAMLKNDSF
jgi:hypothetical protein